MSDHRDKASEDGDPELGQLFGHATPRMKPRPAAEKAAYDALQAEWRELARRGRRRRDLAGIGVAAALLAAVAIGFATLRNPDSVAGGAVATIARVEGHAGDFARRELARPAHRAGRSCLVRRPTAVDRRRLAGRARVAQRRIAAPQRAHRVELVSQRSVRLVAGSLYFDSAASPVRPVLCRFRRRQARCCIQARNSCSTYAAMGSS